MGQEKGTPRPVVRKLKSLVNGKPAEGDDLYDVARLILWELMESRGWSINELARQVGLDFGKLYRYLSAKTPRNRGESKPSGGMDLGTLSQICLHLNDTPVQFFSRHYAEERDRTYVRFRTLLRDLDEANDLADVLEEMQKTPGQLETQLDAWAGLTGIVRRKHRSKVVQIRR